MLSASVCIRVPGTCTFVNFFLNVVLWLYIHGILFLISYSDETHPLMIQQYVKSNASSSHLIGCSYFIEFQKKRIRNSIFESPECSCTSFSNMYFYLL